MGRHLADDVRDIALVGHRAAGKSSLAYALLYETHAVDRLGSVDDGTSFADSDDDEYPYRSSIDAHVLIADHDGKSLNILDTPGTPDFIGAALEALSAADTAVVVVCAVNGVQPNTRKMFREATEQGLSRVVVVNKLDADKVDFPTLVESIPEAFGPQCIPLNLPDAVGPALSNVLSVLDPPADIPFECPADLAEVRRQLVDSVVEADDALRRCPERGRPCSSAG